MQPSAQRSSIPARLDALPWSRWHRRVIVALGITWILDGLEASLVANLGPSLKDALQLDAGQVGITSSVYLVGQVVGALFFGHLTDRAGRKRLFLVTLALYLFATAASGLAVGMVSFSILRFFAGMGLGGEYSAINSAIDELIPARLRGQVDLGINGSYWVGVALGGVVTLLVTHWRLVFLLGALFGLVILFVRRTVPESPRWLLMHGRTREAEAAMQVIEAEVGVQPVYSEQHVPLATAIGMRELLHVLFVRYPRRAVLGIALMLAQAFFYNAIFFSYGLILERFHHVAAAHTGYYVIPFAIGNFLGPLLLGHLFDRVGRRKMITLTYALSALTLLVTGGLFVMNWLTAITQTLAWCATFFFASAAASSAYLTVSELFPVRIRGLAIATFYAIATLAGAAAPTLFGYIVARGDAPALFWAYAFASLLMLAAAIVAWLFAVDSEGRSLEAISA